MDTGNHLGSIVASEATKAVRDIVNDVENPPASSAAETERQLREMERIVRLTALATDAATSGWMKNSAERTKEWVIEL